MNPHDSILSETATERTGLPADRIIPADDPRVTRAVETYLSYLERGERLDRNDFLSAYADIAGPLGECLDALEFIFLTAGHLQLNEADDREPTAAATVGLLGDFQIVREIGRGGMGVVYEAEQVSLHRRVALKVLPFATVLDSRQLKRFQNEAMAAAQLNHPNIVDVFGTGHDRGIHYYAMQYIEGETLADVIDKLISSSAAHTHEHASSADTSPIAKMSTERTGNSTAYFRTLAKIGLQLAEALAYAHSVGIVHRDIKPANLLLDSSGHLWVTDFGLAQIETDLGLTMTGDILGTLRYMSPEQAIGRKGFVDHRTDIYSVGITLYELATLRPAFAGNDRQRLFQQVVEEDPPLPRKSTPSIPRDLETIILKAISKEPTERYTTAGEMAEDLRRFLEHEPIKAKRPTLWDKAAKWSHRKRRSLVVAMIVFALMAMGSTAGMFFIVQEQRRTQVALVDAETNLHIAETQQQRAETLAGQVRRQLYVADMSLAYQAWMNADLTQTVDLLERYQPREGTDDLRGFEWHYLHTLCQGEAITLRGSEGQVYSVAFSPDGQRLASAGEDGIVRLWDTQTGHLLSSTKGHLGEACGVAFSPDGARFASAGDDHTVRVWDVMSGEPRAVLHGHTDTVYNALFSPDGTLLASAGKDAIVRLWDASTLEEVAVLTGDTVAFECLAFSPDGSRLAAAGSRNAQGVVKIWDWDIQALDANETRTLSIPNTNVLSVAFAPDGRILATAESNSYIRLWDLEAGEEKAALRGHASWVQSLAFLPDGHTLMSAGRDATVRFWDISSAEQKGVLRGHIGRVWCAAVSKDGRKLSTAGADGTIRLWDLRKLMNRGMLPVDQRSVVNVAFSADGRLACSVQNDRTTAIWNPSTGEPLTTFTMANAALARQVAFSSDGTTLAAYDFGPTRSISIGEIEVWDLIAGTNRHLLEMPEPRRALAAALSPDGTLLISATEIPLLRMWDLSTGKLAASLAGHTAGIDGLAYSPDGRFVASASSDASIKIWSVPSGQLNRSLPGYTRGVSCILFSHDGSFLVASGNDRTVKVWDLASGRELAHLFGHTNAISAIALTPDDRTLATADDDGAIRLWNAATWQAAFSLEAHAGPITALAFSPDGERLFSSGQSADGQIEFLIWPDAAQRIRR